MTGADLPAPEHGAAAPSASDAGAATRERLLSAALVVFAARGYRCGSMNDVAALAGVTRQGLLHHYPTKLALLLALLERVDEDPGAQSWPAAPATAADLVRAALAAVPGTPEDRLRAQLLHVLAAEACEEGHPAREWVLRRAARAVEALAGVVEESAEEGAVPAGTSPRAVATALVALRGGLEALSLLDAPAASAARAAGDLAGLVEGRPGGEPGGAREGAAEG